MINFSVRLSESKFEPPHGKAGTILKDIPEIARGTQAEDEFAITPERFFRECEIATGQSIDRFALKHALLNFLIEMDYFEILINEQGRELTWRQRRAKNGGKGNDIFSANNRSKKNGKIRRTQKNDQRRRRMYHRKHGRERRKLTDVDINEYFLQR